MIATRRLRKVCHGTARNDRDETTKESVSRMRVCVVKDTKVSVCVWFETR
jgi:hypothetical protein